MGAHSPKSELIARLSEAAREAMPAHEFEKFERSILRGRGPVRMPRDLPPITIDRPTRRMKHPGRWAGNRWVYRDGPPPSQPALL